MIISKSPYKYDFSFPDQSIREIKRFAWLPIETKDRITIWLETYIVLQKFDQKPGSCYGGITPTGWRDIEYQRINES